MSMRYGRRLALVVLLLGVAPAPARAQDTVITLASTTSTDQSGLFGHLLPRFTAATGIAVRVLAVGTGQALDIARRGDADAVLVHDRAAEERFVAEGHAAAPGRRAVMYNDFVLVGPRADPAGIAGGRDAAAALGRIAAGGHPFVSRGDRSGTHAAELRLWSEPPRGAWYREVGQGMGATLNIAAGMGGYTLTDRATWLAFRNRRDLVVLVEGDRRLFNQYGVMVVNQARQPAVKAAAAQRFVDWLVGPEGQRVIGEYRIDGEALFVANADEDGA